MPEFNFDQHPQWNNLDAWRTVLPDDNAVLADPATGKPLGGFHEWLQADPRLMKGVDFLLAHANDIQLTVVRGEHGPDSQDPVARAVIGISDVVGIEGLGAWTEDGFGPAQTNDDSATGKIESAQQAGASLFVYDARADSPVELDRLVCRMATLWDPRYANHPARAKAPGERAEWMVVNEALREPYILARYGYEVMQRWRTIGSRPVKACLTIGTNHKNIPPMFRRTGMQVFDVAESGQELPSTAAKVAEVLPLAIQYRFIPAWLRQLSPQ